MSRVLAALDPGWGSRPLRDLHSPIALRDPCHLRAPQPQPDPDVAQPPFVPSGPHPCRFLVWTGPPQALFLCLLGRRVGSPTPPPPHISLPQASVCGRGGPGMTAPLLLPLHSLVRRELEGLFGARRWRWCVLNATVDLPYPQRGYSHTDIQILTIAAGDKC